MITIRYSWHRFTYWAIYTRDATKGSWNTLRAQNYNSSSQLKCIFCRYLRKFFEPCLQSAARIFSQNLKVGKGNKKREEKWKNFAKKKREKKNGITESSSWSARIIRELDGSDGKWLQARWKVNGNVQQTFILSIANCTLASAEFTQKWRRRSFKIPHAS